MIHVALLTEILSDKDIAEPALLKIDVQGFELSALKGCGALLERFHDIYVECSFVELYGGQAFADEIIMWLQQRGFRLAGVYNLALDSRGLAVQADFHFRCG
jgi:hypothetical protein